MRARWEGRFKDVHHDPSCLCLTVVRDVPRGGSGESEDDVTVMKPSGSGTQFQLRPGEGRTWR